LDVISTTIADIDDKLKKFINETNKSVDLNDDSLKVIFIIDYIYIYLLIK